MEQQRAAAWRRILDVAATRSAQFVTYAAALGAIALIPGAQLPAPLQVVAAGLGVEFLSSIIERVARGERVSDQEILGRLDEAIAASGIDRLLSEKEFYHAVSRLVLNQAYLIRLGEESRQQASELTRRVDEALARLRQVEPLPRPPLFRLPFPRNPNFTGRVALLEQLHKTLTGGRPAAVTQAISGLGGVGKTQLALEYGYRHQSDYDLVWWLRGESQLTLAQDYAALARALALPEAEAPELGQAAAAALAWLGSQARWLLVIDNVEKPAHLKGFLPPAGRGHVLITSRHPAWRAVAETVPVQVLSRAEAVALLGQRSGRPGEEAEKAAVAQALGYLPLALAQAAAYVETTGASFAAYLGLFRARRRELWAQEPAPGDYQATVVTTWQVSMAQLRPETAAADLLNLCAFLAPDDIPRWLLADHLATVVERMGGEEAAEPLRQLAAVAADPLRLNEAVADLRRFSLVETAGDEALGVHRLLQAVVQDRLAAPSSSVSHPPSSLWVEAAVRLVNAAYPDDVTTNVAAWPVCARLLPHGLVATEAAEEAGVAAEATARLLNQMGLYLYTRAEYSQARALYERALVIDEAAFGPNHPNVATSANNLGTLLRELGELTAARVYLERALAIDEATFGPDHPNVAIRANNLGLLLRDLGELTAARAHLERALAIHEATFGPDHPNVATAANNLGTLLYDLGELTAARPYLERALAIVEKVLGPNHPNVATAANNLGLLLKELGELTAARPYLERALAIFERVYGPDHPHTRTVQGNLAGL